MFSLMDVINLILSIKNVSNFYQLAKNIYQSKNERTSITKNWLLLPSTKHYHTSNGKKQPMKPDEYQARH